MILPTQIKTRHKIRDANILRLFLQENLTLNEIGSRFDLTGSRIQQILYDNKHLIDWNRNYEKAIRVNALKRMHKKYESVLGKKSTIDILEQIRKEIEGDKALVDQSQHHTLILQIEKENDNEIKTTRKAMASI